MDDNQYYQVFVNDAYFFKVYPMDSKINYGGALKKCSVNILMYLRS